MAEVRKEKRKATFAKAKLRMNNEKQPGDKESSADLEFAAIRNMPPTYFLYCTSVLKCTVCTSNCYVENILKQVVSVACLYKAASSTVHKHAHTEYMKYRYK